MALDSAIKGPLLLNHLEQSWCVWFVVEFRITVLSHVFCDCIPLFLCSVWSSDLSLIFSVTTVINYTLLSRVKREIKFLATGTKLYIEYI